MAIVVGSNSWVTIAEADTYLTDRIDCEDWFTLADSAGAGALSKTNLLVSAFYLLIKHPSLELSSSLTDDNVKNAQIEFSKYLHKHYEETDSRAAMIASGVRSFRLSKWWEQLSDKGGFQVPNYILGMLSAYNVTGSTPLLLGEYDLE